MLVAEAGGSRHLDAPDAVRGLVLARRPPARALPGDGGGGAAGRLLAVRAAGVFPWRVFALVLAASLSASSLSLFETTHSLQRTYSNDFGR